MTAISSTSEYDLFTEQTVQQIDQLRSIAIQTNQTIGVTFSCFDIMHPGHIKMLADAKKQCDLLVVGLQTDPTIDRPYKNQPIQTYEEREIMVSACRYIDHLIKYATESDVNNILIHLQPDIRILGSDYQDQSFTGDHLSIPIYYHHRNHNWSSTDFRRRIHQAEQAKNSKNID